MSRLSSLPDLKELVARDLPRLPSLIGGGGRAPTGLAPLQLAPAAPNAAYPAVLNSGALEPSWSAGPLPPDRRAHDRLRALVDDGPEAVEQTIRDYLLQAGPEDISQNPRAWWQSALEYLDLPRNAIANLIAGVIGIEPTSKESFAGLRKVYGADFLRAVGWRPESTIGKVGQFLAGLTLDFLVDPLTWLTGGLGAVARGTLKSGARSASELAVDVARARAAGKGLTIAQRHVRPESLDRVLDLTRVAEASALPEGASAVEQAVRQLAPGEVLSGRWGFGAGTHAARSTPLGHVVLGPAILAAQVAGTGTRAAGRLASRIPKVGRLVGKPLELAGAAVELPAAAIARASDYLGTPFRFLPEKDFFVPYRSTPLRRGIEALESRLAASPLVGDLAAGATKVGEAVREAAGRLSIGPGSATQRLIRTYLEQAETGRRREEAYAAEVLGPMVREAARESGIAPEHLEPLYSVFVESMPSIQRAAATGDEAILRAALAEQEAVVREHLAGRYPAAKVIRTTESVMEQVRARAAAMARNPSAGIPGLAGAETVLDTPEIIAHRNRLRVTPRRETADIRTPDRDRLRERIAEELHRQFRPSRERRAFLVIGSPGAGKTSISAPLVEQQGAVLIDADAARTRIPEYDPDNPLPTHREAAQIAYRRLAPKAIVRGENLVWNRIGDNPESLREQIRLLRKEGYQVHLVHVRTSPLEAARRALHRRRMDRADPRWVDPAFVIHEVGEAPEQVYHLLKEEVDGYAQYDNERGIIEPIETSEGFPPVRLVADRGRGADVRGRHRQRQGGAGLHPAAAVDVVNLDLPGTRYGRSSIAYKNGATGSEPEAARYAAETLTPSVVEVLRRRFGEDRPLVFVPIPSTSGAENQVPSALARTLATKLGGEVAELLGTGTYRKRRVKGHLERLANPRDFVASESAVLPAGARIVLVDDVLTTGGTVRDAVEALAAAGFQPAAAVIGKSRLSGVLRASAGQIAQLRASAGDLAERLESAIQRPLDSITRPEAEALLRVLRSPGASARELALRIERAREIPLAGPGAPRPPVGSPAGRRATEEALLALYGDLEAGGLIADIEAMSRQAKAQGAGSYGDVEVPLAAGYTFTPGMKGEAEALRQTLRDRGYGRLVGRVKLTGPGAPVSDGDDALSILREVGDPDPIERMAEAIIAHHEQSTKAGRIRLAVDWIERNPEVTTPQQKHLARRWKALVSGAPEVRQAARGKGDELVRSEDLEPGDRLEIAGESHTVVDKGSFGVIVKDGEEIHLAPGEAIVADRGTHRPDPVEGYVSDAVGALYADGRRPTPAAVYRWISDQLPAAQRDAELRSLFGVPRVKGQRRVIESRIELALLRSGESTRGINWENLLTRLEEVESGRVGRGGVGHLGKIESESHPLGAFVRDRIDPISGRISGRQELTDLGRRALRAMRANLAAGGEPQQVARLTARIQELHILQAKRRRAGQPIPAGLSSELTRREQVLERMGRSIEDEAALRIAADRAVGRPPLPGPAPRDLFAPAIADLVEEMLRLGRTTQAAEVRAGLATADITETTERGLGYFPRILGNARTVVGKLYRRWGHKWAEEWRRAGRDLETPGHGETGVPQSTHQRLNEVIRNENAARSRRGQPLIPEVSPDSDLAVALMSLERDYPELFQRHGHLLRRIFLRENMIHEVNALAGVTGVAFESDPVSVWLKRRTAMHYAVAGADFLRAAIRNAEETKLAVRVKPKGPVPADFERVTDARLGPLAEGYALHKDLARELKKFMGQVERPHVILRAFDWAARQWKTSVLGVFPYTMMNLLSGVFQANQFDAFRHRTWQAALRFMEDYHRGVHLERPLSRYVPDLPAGYRDLTIRDFYDTLSVEHGALGRGFYGTELEQAVKHHTRTEWGVADSFLGAWSGERKLHRVLRGAAGITRGRDGTWHWELGEAAYFKAFRAINVAIEDWMKIGFTLERMRRGDDLATAVQKGKAALNQSADMSQFERAYLRRLFPFWGWMRGNAVLQFTMMVNRPQVTGLVEKIRGNLEASIAGEETLPPELRPRHVAEELGAQLGGGSEPNFLNLTRFYPVKELGTTPAAGPAAPRATLEALLQGLNPFVRGIIESAANRDLYWDRPITEYRGQRRRWLGLQLPPEVKRYARMLRPLNVLEQLSWRGIPTTAEDAGAFAGQAFGLRLFPVDVRRQVFEEERRLRDQQSAVMRDFSRARSDAERAGRDWRADAEVRRLAAIYEELQEARDALPLRALRSAGREGLAAGRVRRRELREFAAAR